MDSDGSIVWDYRNIYKKPYPRISITTVSKSLAMQVKSTLENMGFSVYFKAYKRKDMRSKVYHIDLVYGFEQLKKWKKEIGFSNPKNIVRLMPQ